MRLVDPKMLSAVSNAEFPVASKTQVKTKINSKKHDFLEKMFPAKLRR